MIREIIEFVTRLKRPELIDARNGQHIYCDSKASYERIPDNRPFNRNVCNVDSLAKVVIEEEKRGLGDGLGGGKTVIFEENGGTFYTDDSLTHEQDLWYFNRKHTNLWHVVKKLVSNEQATYTHLQLLETLASVKNYIPNFETLYQTISKLRASKKISFVSNPIFEDGERSGSYLWEQKIDSNGLTEKAVCPSEIPFRGKIVRGSEIEYEFSLSLTPVLDDEKGQIRFALSMPGIDMVLDQVREDEYTAFCELVKPLTGLLILRNY